MMLAHVMVSARMMALTGNLYCGVGPYHDISCQPVYRLTTNGLPINDISQCYGVSLCNLLTHIMVLARTVVLAYIVVFACVMVLAVNPYYSVSLSLGINC